MHSEAQTVRATLVRRAKQGADAARIADASVSIWRGIDAALSPIIGEHGVAALYKRSLHLIRPAYPWLAAVHERSVQPGDFAALRTGLAEHPDAEAATASDAVLQTFLDLLSSLIGDSLTDQLLASVCDHSSSGVAAQDITP